MTTGNAMEATRDLEWEAESLRVSTLLPADEPDATTWWDKLVGEEPTTTTTRRGIETKTEGPFRGRQLSLIVRPDRVDWLLSPAITTPPDEPTIATIGGFVESLDILRDIATRWMQMEHCPSFQRLALGAALLSPVDDRESGYRRLSAYLPAVKLDADVSRDFSYQINRPRVSDCLDLDMRINRLCRWSVARFEMNVLSVAGGQGTYLRGPKTFACRLHLDINTDAEYTDKLDGSQMLAMFEVLANCAVEIAKDGDQP